MSDAQKLHNFAAKVAIGGAKKFDHATPIIIQELGLLKIEEKYVLDTCTVVFKIINGYYNKWFKDFKTVHEITNSRTRQRDCLYVPNFKTDSGARSLAVMGPNIWNSLPSCVTEACSLPTLKRHLITHLLNARQGL